MKIIKPFGQIPSIIRKDDNESFVPSIFIANLFNEKEILKIINLWDENLIEDAKVLKGGKTFIDNVARKSRLMFLTPDGNDWIYDRLALACILTNARTFKFDILGFQTQLKLVEYTIKDFFAWHIDFGSHNSSTRKISFSVQLSDPADYEGGELQFIASDSVTNAPKTKGTAIIFPSFIAHRVTPIISGNRKVIVGHICGPPYR